MTLREILPAGKGAQVAPGARGGEGAAGPRVSALARAPWRAARVHPTLVVLVGACAALWRQSMHTGLSGDVFYQVASGQWMLTHHAVLSHDVFSYTVAGRPWTNEEWGFQVLLAWLVAHVGAVSYWLVPSGACTAALLLAVARWRRAGAGRLWAAALGVLATAGLSTGLAPRPQDVSYLLFSLLLLVLTLARHQARWLWAVPPLMALWANLHGSFLLGLAVLVLEVAWSLLPPLSGRAAAGHPLRPKAAGGALLAGLLASLANPYGPKLLAYALHVSTAGQLTSLIAEWQSPDFHSYFYLAVIFGPVALLGALLALTPTVPPLEDLVLAALLLVATLHAVRFTPYYVLAASGALARWRPLRQEPFQPTFVALPLAAALAASLLVGPHVPAGAPQTGDGSLATPVAAVRFLRHQSGRVFSTYWWDDYLVYEHVPVFVDGRTDLYFGAPVLQEYVDISTLSTNPDALLRRWDVRWVMWAKASALSTYLAADPQWVLRAKAGPALVFERRGPGGS